MYRFLSKLTTLDRLQAFPIPVLGKEIRTGVGLAHYERKMEPLVVGSDITGVKLLKAPLFQSKPTGLYLKFHDGFETQVLPDIWGCFCKLFISDKVKKIIETFDDFEHEFTKIECIDFNDQMIKTDQKYYLFNQRRWVSIEPSDPLGLELELEFFPEKGSEDFLGRLVDDSSLQEYLNEFPIWQSFAWDVDFHEIGMKYRSILYFNSMLTNELKKATVTGLDSESLKCL